MLILKLILGVLTGGCFAEDKFFGIRASGLSGAQLPPPHTGYADQFNNCGLENECKNDGTIWGCHVEYPHHRRRKRGARKPSFNQTRGEDYILGGGDVNHFTYPWVGKLQKNTRENGIKYVWDAHCTLSLISNRHALTALHCFKDEIELGYGQNHYISSDEIRILFGFDHDSGKHISKDQPIPEQQLYHFAIRYIETLSVPPKRDGNTHDFALLFFKPIKFSDGFRPICLPLYGVPVSDYYVHAGYGFVGVDDNGNHKKKLYLQEARNLKVSRLQIEEPEKAKHFEAYHAETNPVTPHFMLSWPADQSGCNGDSGGPVMYQHETNGRYSLIGIMSGGDTGYASDKKEFCLESEKIHAHMSSVQKVSYFLQWLVEKMSPLGWEDTCLHPECAKFPAASSRSWILNVDDGTETEARLSAPCAHVPELSESNNVTEFICPKNISSDRQISVGRTHYINESDEAVQNKIGIRFCHSCSTSDWKRDTMLDDLTAGSFSQPHYDGIFAIERSLLPQPDRSNEIPFFDLCDLDHDHDGYSGTVACPMKGSITGETCIPSQSICDGYSDCEDGWDESPHLCLGKCDFWLQYQSPHYVYTEVASGVVKVDHSSSVTTVKECEEKCHQDQECTRFNWYGLESSSYSHPACILLHGFSKAVESTIPKEKYAETSSILEVAGAIRGPKECPLMFADKGGKRTSHNCEPVNSAPYKAGIYQIQAYNGLWAENIKNKMELTSKTYEEVNKFNESDMHWNRYNLSCQKTDQWFIRSGRVSRITTEIYFEIASAYGCDEDKPKVLTWRKDAGSKVVLTEKLENTFDNRDASQKLYITTARRERGFVDVKIFVKIRQEGGEPEKQYFLTVNKDFFNGHPEYHHRDYEDFEPDGQPLTPPATELEWQEELTEAGELSQTFRLYLCYYPEHEQGLPFRGISRPKAYGLYPEGVENEKKLEKMFISEYGDPFSLPPLEATLKPGQLPTNGTIARAENLFKYVFGISHARFYHMVQGAVIEKTNLWRTILKAMSDCNGIWDYAGIMRIGDQQFKAMYDTWLGILQNDDRLKNRIFCNVENNAKLCLKNKDGFIDYMKNKVDFLRYGN